MKENKERTSKINHYESLDSWNAVDTYFNENLVKEDEALRIARKSGERTTMPNAEVSASQGALLALFAKSLNAKRVLEFGTLAGYSTIWFARAVGSEGKVVTLELEEQNANIARENFKNAGVMSQIEILIGPAIEGANQLIERNEPSFDLVFIDADKPNNPKYLEAALKLTQKGSLIVIDNVVRNGEVVNKDSDDLRVQGVRNVVEDIKNNKNLKATAIQTVGEKGWDGFILVYRD